MSEQTKQSDDILNHLKSVLAAEALDVKTVVKELQSAYDNMESLVIDNRLLSNKLKEEKEWRVEAEKSLELYKKEFVEPAIELKKRQEELNRKEYNWNIEKTWMEKMINLLRDMLSATLTKQALSGSFNLSGYLPPMPGSGQSGNVSGSGNIGMIETKPNIGG